MVEYEVESTGEVGTEALDLLGLGPQMPLEKKLAIEHIISKLPRIRATIGRLEALAEAEKVRAKEVQDRARALSNAAKRIEDQLLYQMDLLDIEAIHADGVSATVRINNPKLVIDDQAQIPKQYTTETISYELNKDAIKQDLILGKEVNGARIERGKHIRLSAGIAIDKLK